MKEMAIANKEIVLKLNDIENRLDLNQEGIRTIFEALKQLLHTPNPPRERIGFKQYD